MIFSKFVLQFFIRLRNLGTMEQNLFEHIAKTIRTSPHAAQTLLCFWYCLPDLEPLAPMTENLNALCCSDLVTSLCLTFSCFTMTVTFS